ncbi:MAG: galactofuranose transport system permease protein [Frankiaceae bacterium]|nr:galactofuranose transport system permease protein [Frankiaceae bacterium]
MSSEDVISDPSAVPGPAAHAVTPPSAQRDRGDRIAATIQRLAPFVVLAATIALGAAAFGGHFMSVDTFRIIAEDRVSLGLVAIGMTFVIISGGIDLSVGSVLALGAVLTAYSSLHWGPVAAVLVPLLACGSVGLINGLLIAKTKMAPFIVTLASLLFARGFALYVTNNATNIPNVRRTSGVTKIGQGKLFGVPVPIVITVALFAIAAVILNRTRSGQCVFALGGSEDAAILMGLPVARIKVLLYTASGLLAGLAGMVTATRSLSGDPNLANGLELQAIAAVVIGGTLLTGGAGTISGTLAGVLLLGVIRNLITQKGTLAEYHQDLVFGTFLIIVVIAQKLLSKRQRT